MLLRPSDGFAHVTNRTPVSRADGRWPGGLRSPGESSSLSVLTAARAFTGTDRTGASERLPGRAPVGGFRRPLRPFPSPGPALRRHADRRRPRPQGRGWVTLTTATTLSPGGGIPPGQRHLGERLARVRDRSRHRRAADGVPDFRWRCRLGRRGPGRGTYRRRPCALRKQAVLAAPDNRRRREERPSCTPATRAVTGRPEASWPWLPESPRGPARETRCGRSPVRLRRSHLRVGMTRSALVGSWRRAGRPHGSRDGVRKRGLCRLFRPAPHPVVGQRRRRPFHGDPPTVVGGDDRWNRHGD